MVSPPLQPAQSVTTAKIQPERWRKESRTASLTPATDGHGLSTISVRRYLAQIETPIS